MSRLSYEETQAAAARLFRWARETGGEPGLWLRAHVGQDDRAAVLAAYARLRRRAS